MNYLKTNEATKYSDQYRRVCFHKIFHSIVATLLFKQIEHKETRNTIRNNMSAKTHIGAGWVGGG